MLFSWLGQKVNKKVDVYAMATMPMTLAWTCAHGHAIMPRHGKTSQHCSIFESNLKPVNIRMRFYIRFK